jgi:8-oxo-dGTP pyrophosphatase MutT (NUDIX family)
MDRREAMAQALVRESREKTGIHCETRLTTTRREKVLHLWASPYSAPGRI